MTLENKVIVTGIEVEQWYRQLIEDLKDIIIEKEFDSRWSLIECYHLVGLRLLQEESRFTDAGYLKMSSQVADSLGKSQRTIENCLSFARKYPDLNLLPLGKNASWHKICNEILPEHTESISKPLTKADLIQMLKEIKILLQHEWMRNNQAKIHSDTFSNDDAFYDEPLTYTNVCDYIHYLQDQFNKIVGELKLS